MTEIRKALEFRIKPDSQDDPAWLISRTNARGVVEHGAVAWVDVSFLWTHRGRRFLSVSFRAYRTAEDGPAQYQKCPGIVKTCFGDSFDDPRAIAWVMERVDERSEVHQMLTAWAAEGQAA